MTHNEILSQEHAERPTANLFCIREVSRNVSVLITRQTPPRSPAIDAEVAAIWSREKVVKPDLFNGQVFSVDRSAHNRIEGQWTKCRQIVACLARSNRRRRSAHGGGPQQASFTVIAKL